MDEYLSLASEFETARAPLVIWFSLSALFSDQLSKLRKWLLMS